MGTEVSDNLNPNGIPDEARLWDGPVSILGAIDRRRRKCIEHWGFEKRIIMKPKKKVVHPALCGH